MGKITSPQRRPSAQAYRLYGELEWMRPKVWRPFLVPIAIELPLLHTTLLLVPGDKADISMSSSSGGYGRREPGLALAEVIDEEHGTLNDALGARKKFVYVYDYGDNWRHTVKVEKIGTLDAPISSGVCIGAENACPPEDIGGGPGYEHFLAALADPSDPEHDHFKQWIGRSFDLAEFDVAQVNQRLRAHLSVERQER